MTPEESKVLGEFIRDYNKQMKALRRELSKTTSWAKTKGIQDKMSALENCMKGLQGK